jgi:branched-chain amino acid transport system ATP-binding protein
MMAHREGISIEHVSRHFDGVRALDDINFVLRPGETLALVGPNGAGKSTLVQLISGIDRPSKGQIWLDNTRLDRRSPERIAALGVTRSFQTSRVFPALSVWDSVSIGVYAQSIKRSDTARSINALGELLLAFVQPPRWRRRLQTLDQRVEKVLELFGDRLAPRRDHPAFSLSYANRRRLEIARALVAGPRYLLLDEPAAGMNPSETIEIGNLLKDLRQLQPSLGILLIEHKLSLVRELADRVIVLNQGEILIEDSPARALDHPEVVEAYLGRRRSARSDGGAHLG